MLHIWDWFLLRFLSGVSYQIGSGKILKMGFCTIRCGVFRKVSYSVTELRGRILKSLPQTYSPLISTDYKGNESLFNAKSEKGQLVELVAPYCRVRGLDSLPPAHLPESPGD